MSFFWSEEKSAVLKAQRGIGFEDVVDTYESGGFLGVRPHPTRPSQVLLLVRIDGYACVCPAVSTAEGYFFKTVYRSRKLQRSQEA